MKTKVVSFRLPVKEYANLLLEAGDMDLSDFIIQKLYRKENEAEQHLGRYDCNFQLRYQSLLKNLLKTTKGNIDIEGLEKQYGPGTRMAVLDQKFMDQLKKELELLK